MKMWRRGVDRFEPSSPRETVAEPDERWAVVTEALESVPVGLVVKDRTGSTLVANHRASAPLGDLTGDTLADVALGRALSSARAGEPASESVDIAGTRPRRVEVTATPLRAGGVVATIVDSSERLRLDAVRRDFVANVNHELRTPIGALTVLADALVAEREHATIERLATRIQAEAARARALIDDLLDFARVEADDQPSHHAVDVAVVVDVAVARVSAVATQRHVRIDIDAVAEAAVQGDHEQLVVAVANLLDNAIKYSDEHTIVHVDVGAHADDSVIEIAVRDHGIGIPARDLDRIFERFYRVDQARDRRTGGTGLGLAIVRHVAANHRGEITVVSEEGAGSTFTLRLPRR